MRRVRRKGGNKEKVFGCDLIEHLTASSQEIPQVLRCCTEFVEQHGIVDGIYRLSGVSSNIQKLRGEFENDGKPDLNKDVYLQDIHCISSLCKAYFRELPNPLLTYQLYDKFAEAVAIQLEEERLVKIRDVLKELPEPHYRTLEFLMRHLVKMASYSSETNMHARNLAIVWAPNLLRSKDIEASGFNGTAAFMEVRVQSIVVEFILTHVPQLFPEQGLSNEQRKPLPSPATISNQDEGFFKPFHTQHIINFGNISPGDGPLAIRPYHAIIEGTDKRKGSLKGRKWMSIFNIGGRFPDPRRRHRHSAKEKEQPAIRPARSMDSLSTPLYPNEASRRPQQRPPSNISPLVTSSPLSGSEIAVSSGAIGGSEYAVTYRRGTGLVSGGAGTQGTYTALDPEGLGLAGSETLQSRSPGLSTKVGRRAAMHITGPTMVTVPLHITSNLALGVLQGGGSDRVIHRGREKDAGVEGKKEGEKVEKKESKGIERKVEEEGRNNREKDGDGDVDMKGTTVAEGGVSEEKGEGAKEEEKKEEEVSEDCRWKPEQVTGGVSRDRRAKSLNSNTNDEDAADDDQDEYMEMKGGEPADCQPGVTQPADTCVFDVSDVLNSTELEREDQELSGYVQDNFEFLDQMDCSVLDHMDCSVSYQVNEFSVEPPGHSDDEYELMVQAQNSHHPAELQTHLQPGSEMQNEFKPHRPLSLDLQNRHTKSLSLPYMTSPIHGPVGSSSEEEDAGDISDDNDYNSEEDESMFVQSLPPDFFLNNLSEFELDTDSQENCTLDKHPVDQSESSEARESETLHCKELPVGDQEQAEVKDEDELDGNMMKEEEDVLDKGDPPEKHVQRTAAEDLSVTTNSQGDNEKPPTPEVLTQHSVEFPLPTNEDTDEYSTMADMKIEELEEVVDNLDFSPCHTDSCAMQEIADVLLEESREFSVESTEHPGTCVREDTDTDERVHKEIEEKTQEMVVEINENDENTCGEPTEEGGKGTVDRKHKEEMLEDGKEWDSVICRPSSDIWVELEEVICELIEDEESEQAEKEGCGEEEEQKKVSGEKIVGEEEDGTKKTDIRIEVGEELMKTTGETPQIKRKEVVSKEQEKANDDKERGDELRTPPSEHKQLNKAMSDVKKLQEGRKCEESRQGGVGRKLVISKHPKVYQVKAVPVVPPKPQHCKITALTLRQQQQQRDSDRENVLKVQTEQDQICAGEQGRSEGEKERERRRDEDDGAMRDMSGSSPLSMCFDEAVAIATIRREKEKEHEKERHWGGEVQ
uniref:rho GTPase-activating protein 30 n=1 Tax=Monopterus albus TaxID=43700 RepID=UPI0009B2F230|nr:rho GTPase-activating protein 30-like [Monopterus albus]